jgi:ubiquinone/menaquinone biosynthesis C-methylase UbiE
MPLAVLHKPIYARRIQILSSLIAEQLRENDRVLDIGSGSGELAAQIAKRASDNQRTISIQGAEKHPRGDEAVETIAFDGYTIPVDDGHYDVTILADVVHHEEDYMKLLREAVRVTKRYLIIKDHVANGFLAYPRICFMDWAANNPYGVKCLYRYFSVAQWKEHYAELGLTIEKEWRTIRLYPEPFNFIFGNRLQYLAVLEKTTS